MSKQIKNKQEIKMVFDKKNYTFMIAGVVLIFLGLILLSGGGSNDPSVFNPDIFDTRRIVIAPLVMLVGFMLEIYAIMYKNKQKS